jgi:hypothetical protein
MAINGKRTQSDYSLAFNLGVVEAVEKGEMAYKQPGRQPAGRRSPATGAGAIVLACTTASAASAICKAMVPDRIYCRQN